MRESGGLNQLDRARVAFAFEILVQQGREFRSGGTDHGEQRHQGLQFHVVRLAEDIQGGSALE